jgi:hypothetical protein
MSLNIKNVLTTASIVLYTVDDSYKYQAELISSNGEIFQPYDTDTLLSFRIYKGFEDVTNDYTDIVWRRFSFESDNIEEDSEWGLKYNGYTELTLNKNEVDGKCLIQVDAYDSIRGKRTCIATARIFLIDINEMFSNNTPPYNPIDGTIWVDTSRTPSAIKTWDGVNKKWIEVGKADQAVRNLIRNSNFWTLSSRFYDIENEKFLYSLVTEDIANKRYLRLKSKMVTDTNQYAGIGQKTTFPIKQNDFYNFSLKAYAKTNNTYTGDLLSVRIFSISTTGKTTEVSNKLHQLKDTELVQISTTFKTLSDTESIYISISVSPTALCDFYITELSLYNTNTFYPWELSPEDVADLLEVQNNLSHEAVFKALTDNGKIKGIFEMTDPETGKNQIYINGTYIEADSISGSSIKSGAVNQDKIEETLKGIINNSYDRVKEWAYGAIEESTTINGGLIQTNTILANRIMLGDFSNLCLVSPDSITANLYEADIEVVNNKNYFKFNGQLLLNQMYGNPTFKEGDVYRLSFEGSTSSTKQSLHLYIREFYTDGSYLDRVHRNWDIEYVFKTHEFQFEIEKSSEANKIIDHIDIFLMTDIATREAGSLMYARDILINKKASAELIVDGAITADKIVGNAIDGKTITGATFKTSDGKFVIDDFGLVVNGGLFSVDTAGNVTATTLKITGDQIVDGTVSGDAISTDTITGNNIVSDAIINRHIAEGALDNKTITGSIIQSTNKKIILSDSGLNINNVFKIDKDGIGTSSNFTISGGSININEKFKVTIAGKATCSDISISNGSITKSSFTTGTGDEIVIDNNGININNGAFKVSKDGKLTCKDININNEQGSIGNIKINTNNITNNAVTQDKIADNSISTNKVIDKAITKDKLADESISTDKIINKNITKDKLNDELQTELSTNKTNIESLQNKNTELEKTIKTMQETIVKLEERIKALEPKPEEPKPEEPETPPQS